MFRWMIILILAAACTSGPEAIREDSQVILRNLIREFQGVKSRETLMEREAKIQILFDRLVGVLVDAKKYIDTHEQELEFKWKDQNLSDELKGELNRLYRLEGCREIIERCERKSLERFQETLEVGFPTH